MTAPVIQASDLATYLGLTVDSDRATFLIAQAQTLCESVVAPLPDGASAVVLDVAARAYLNPGNVQQETVGPFAATRGAGLGGLWLTRQNERALRRLAGGGGAFTIDVMPATAGQNLPGWDTGTEAPW